MKLPPGSIFIGEPRGANMRGVQWYELFVLQAYVRATLERILASERNATRYSANSNSACLMTHMVLTAFFAYSEVDYIESEVRV